MNMTEIYDSAPSTCDLQQHLHPTGVLGLDLLLGGGWVIGRLCEISGEEQSGKSTLAWHGVAAAQARGDVPAIVSGRKHEVENWLLHNCGVDLGGVVIVQADEYDEALEVACGLLETGDVDFLVVDDLQRSRVDRGRARLTKPRANALAMATQRASATTLLLVDTTLPWLDAHPFWIGQHVHTRYAGQAQLAIRAVRTATGFVGRTIHVPVRESGGVDAPLHLLRLAAQLHLVEDKHGHFAYRGHALGHGARRAAAAIAGDAELAATLAERIRTSAYAYFGG